MRRRLESEALREKREAPERGDATSPEKGGEQTQGAVGSGETGG